MNQLFMKQKPYYCTIDYFAETRGADTHTDVRRTQTAGSQRVLAKERSCQRRLSTDGQTIE